MKPLASWTHKARAVAPAMRHKKRDQHLTTTVAPQDAYHHASSAERIKTAPSAEAHGALPTPQQQVALFNLATPLSAMPFYDRCVRAAVGATDPQPAPLSGKEAGLIDNDGIASPKQPYIVPPSTPLVVFDLDGTLTTGNRQLFRQLLHHSHRAKARVSAAEVTWAWAARGYGIVYLTGRPWWLAPMTRNWFRWSGLAPGIVHFTHKHTEMLPISSFTGVFKHEYLTSLRRQGYQIHYAYGNVATDVFAYRSAGIPLKRIVMTGSKPARFDTLPAPVGFGQHLSYVLAQPPRDVRQT